MKPSAECPSVTTLSAWLDDETDTVTLERTRSHVRECQVCREQALTWVEAVRVLPSHPTRSAAPAVRPDEAASFGAVPEGCLDEERLVAYCDAQLSTGEAVRAEQHLGECGRCVGEVQRLIAVRVAMQEAAEGPAPAAPPQRVGEVRRRVASLRDMVQSVGHALARPWPAVGMLVATAMLAVVVARLLPSGGSGDDIRYRSIAGTAQVAVLADGVVAQARPGDDQAAVVTLKRGTVASRLEESNAWTRIQLADGRRVWVRSTQVALTDATPQR
jgi:anti-sigma factor RsiW